MKLADFDYQLPKQLIAQEPLRPRDHSRLLVLRKPAKETKFLRFASANRRNLVSPSQIEHRHFYDILDYLHKGDVLVLNNSKVFPARLIGKRQGTGGKVEVFLLKKSGSTASRAVEPLDRAVWQCLVGGPRRKAGLTVEFGQGLAGEIIADNRDGTWAVRFNKAEGTMRKIVERIGHVPLPPYIKRDNPPRSRPGRDRPSRGGDLLMYQTVYADDKKPGSVAAPTAGFHFTPALLKKIEKKGIAIEYVTLHVGLGTFAPVKADDIRKHKMHAEYVEADKNVIARIVKAKQEKRRVIAVGTTAVRTLEAIFSVIASPAGAWRSRDSIGLWRKSRSVDGGAGLPRGFAARNDRGFAGWVDIFIYPGYKFKVVDAMITNFHLPKSTLLMLVSAFTGVDIIKRVYREAISKQYRFYSYGDAMLII